MSRMAKSRLRIKFCGMTRRQDIDYAASLGVDAIGLVFYPKSPRYLSIKEAALLVRDLPLFISLVAVFVSPEVSLVKQALEELPLTSLQFHGDESPQFCSQFKKSYIKAIPAHSAEEIKQAVANYSDASAILLDTPTPALGGSGQPFAWQIIPSLDKPFILAGGLHAANVREALRHCSPYALDVCSGVEVAPGIKDHKKMKQFVNAIWGQDE